MLCSLARLSLYCLQYPVVEETDIRVDAGQGGVTAVLTPGTPGTQLGGQQLQLQTVELALTLRRGHQAQRGHLENISIKSLKIFQYKYFRISEVTCNTGDLWALWVLPQPATNTSSSSSSSSSSS